MLLSLFYDHLPCIAVVPFSDFCSAAVQVLEQHLMRRGAGLNEQQVFRCSTAPGAFIGFPSALH
jgi:hypothetical protein